MNSTLFPPIVDSILPAFRYYNTSNEYTPDLDPTDDADEIASPRMRFSIKKSSYNTWDEIKEIQFKICYQSNGEDALNGESYLGICMVALENGSGVRIPLITIDDDEEDRMYITLSQLIFKELFKPDTYYTIQMRFSSVTRSQHPSGINGSRYVWNADPRYINNNLDEFSEWSRIGVIRCIYNFEINLLNPKLGSYPDLDKYLTDSDTLDVFGRIAWKKYRIDETTQEMIWETVGDSVEKIDSMDIQLSNFNNSYAKYYSSGEFKSNDFKYNRFSHIINYRLLEDIDYRLKISITTTNGYSESFEDYKVKYRPDSSYVSPYIDQSPDEKNSSIKILISKDFGDQHNLPNNTTVIIKRSNSKNNFQTWEEVYNSSYGGLVDGGLETHEFKDATGTSHFSRYRYFVDKTIESGTVYRYGIQYLRSDGGLYKRTITREANEMISHMFDDMYLTEKNIQLNIKFNPTISSTKRIVSETKVDTIGSQFPYIRKNGSISYRQFSIGGLITAYCDENGDFLKNAFSEDTKSYYEEYNEKNFVTPYNDFTYERFFREKVLAFLGDGKVKLFRSAPEGNILVRLTDINVEPKTELGRMLYSFTGTAYEIDDCSVENYKKYKIL